MGTRAFYEAVTADNIFHVLIPVGDFQIGIVIRFAGRIEHRILEQALRLTPDAVPIICSRFVPGWRTGSWEPVDRNLLTLEHIPSVCPDGGDILKFFQTPVNHLAGPLVKAALFHGDTDTLCLNVSHIVADAGGVKAYSALLASIYTRLLEDRNYRPRALQNTSRSLRQITGQFSRWQKLGIARQALKDIIAQPPFPRPCTLPGYKTPDSHRVYVTHRIDQELTGRMQAWCSTHEATINDVLMAALFRSFGRICEENGSFHQNPAHRMIITADLRRYLPSDQAAGLICNLSGWVPVSLDRQECRTMADACRAVSRVMQKKKREYLGLGIVSAVAAGIKIMPLCLATFFGKKIVDLASSARVVAPSFTNMGRLDPNLLDFGGMDISEAFLLPPVVYPPIFGCGVSSLKNTLTLSAGICEPGFNKETVTRLFSAVAQDIRSL